MAWIESHSTLARHPKTLRLARRLGVSVPTAIGHLHLLWWWALEYAQDGDVSAFDDEEVADACVWEGEPAAFRRALTAAGFLDDGGAVHDWDTYTVRLMERRERQNEQARLRMQAYRERQKAQERNSQVVTQDVTRNGSERYAPTVPNPTVTEPSLSPTEREAPGAEAPDASPAQLRLSIPKSQTTDAVRAANTVLGKKCNEAERAAINEAIPATPQAQTLWESCLRRWKLRYERNKGLEGPIDWFKAGGAPDKPGGGRTNGTPKSASSRLNAVIERATNGHPAANGNGGWGGPGVGVPQVRRGVPGELPG